MSMKYERIVITGTLSRDREDVFHEIIKAGGFAGMTVQRDRTTLLVIGDKPGATKVAQAKKWMIPITDEKGLWSLLRTGTYEPIAAPETPPKRGETAATNALVKEMAELSKFRF